MEVVVDEGGGGGKKVHEEVDINQAPFWLTQ
jgi:hypothetical protein